MEKLEKLLGDIRFWIVLFFLIRLIGITNPPLEVAHNWRQTAVNTVARNFHEIDNNIFYPRFDTAGNSSGISGTEFPLFNYLIYLSNLIFGYSHWYGRLINLIVSSFGIWAFYQVVKDHFSEKTAFYGTIVLLSSLWFAFSRKIMPDTFSISLCLISLAFALRFLKNGGFMQLLLYCLFASLGILSKIPAIVVLTPLAFSILSEHYPLQRKFWLISISIIPLAFSAWWYFYWFDHITDDFVLYRMGPGIQKGFFQLIATPNLTLNNFYFDALKFSGFALTLFGVYKIIKRKDIKLLAVVVLYSFAFLVFMLQAGYGFRIHEYYTLPYVPLMALIAGYGLSLVRKPFWGYLLLTIIVFEGILNQQHDFFIKDNNWYKLGLESLVSEVAEKDELVIVNGGENPQMMYFAHRRGWSIDAETLSKKGEIQTLRYEGASYLIWDKHLSSQFHTQLPVLFENEDFVFYDLRKEM
ncbi:MAG TPA: hypothetical protein DCR48_03750 [Flavobacteriales bacterium]|nr:hypothetical protein [Flavobacteriales bacterium]